MVDNSPQAVAIDPQWLPHSYDLDGFRLTSVFVPREKHAELMFLSDEHYPPEILKVTHLASDIAAHLPAAAIAPIHFVFHTAFCGSTLMVKALDIPGRTAGLKEPDVLINLANRLARSDDLVNRQRLQLVLRLLARPSLPGETMIVKPSNFANRLIRPILETMPEARAMLMWSDLPTLLRSLVKRGMWGRIWGRKLFRSAGAWTALNFGYDPGETFELTDLQVAGLAWLMQIHHFSQIASSFGPRVITVDSSSFIGDPAETLSRVSRFFGLDLKSEEVGDIANGPVFSRHSKFLQRDYSVDEREAEHDAAVAAHGEEIEMVVKWVEAVAAHCRVALKPA